MQALDFNLMSIFLLLSVTFPHLLHTVCVLFRRMPKELVPFVMVRPFYFGLKYYRGLTLGVISRHVSSDHHNSGDKLHLELKLLEEPSVLARLVSLLELSADHVSCLLLLHGILNKKHNW